MQEKQEAGAHDNEQINAANQASSSEPDAVFANTTAVVQNGHSTVSGNIFKQPREFLSCVLSVIENTCMLC